MDKIKQTNHCHWCDKETNMPSSYFAMSPIIPKMEEKMQKVIKKYGDEWWEDLEKDNPKLLDELSFYDQLTSTVGKGFVCAKCLDIDNTNWIKYRKE